ncbi:MAG: class I SAM-dependent methyltransferase [Chloroflexia bacterium]|nr:class I SAM-dependent methyltransferase [Chloroflexia bacterium]
MPQTDLQRTARHWDAEGAWKTNRGLYWLELPAVQSRLNQKVSEQADVDWVQYTLSRHLAGRTPVERCLSLGCGRGGLERYLASLSAFSHCDACDLAEASIAEARLAAARKGDPIHYFVCDLNETVFQPKPRYNVVWAAGIVHHVQRLESLFQQVHNILKPDGFFVLNEYIGPNRFQFPPRQRQLIQACWELLPPDYRQPVRAATAQRAQRTAQQRDLGWLLRRSWEKILDGDLLPALRRRLNLHRAVAASGVRFPSARDVAATDPSEAIRSAEIVPLLQRDFEIVEFKPLGGSILQFLLADIAGNFQTTEGERLLKMLFAIEDALMEIGALQSDFAYIVAAPLPASDGK